MLFTASFQAAVHQCTTMSRQPRLVIATARICSSSYHTSPRCTSSPRNTNLDRNGIMPLLGYFHNKFNTPVWTGPQFYNGASLLRTRVPLNSVTRFWSMQHNDKKPEPEPVKVEQMVEPKKTLWQKFKQMYKEYWYILVPVHLVTSTVWYGSFYYIAISGIDIVPMLESMGASETILKPLRDTGAGFFAVAYAMYKIATPVRYTITLGGTTITINYLKKWGYIKPMPSGEQMKEMIREKGRQLRSRRARVLAKMNLRRKGSTRTKTPEQPK